MTPELVLSLAQQAVQIALMMTSVILLPALAVGLLVSMFQAATSINEQTLSFIPKLMVTFITLLIAGPWMLKLIINFTTRVIENIPYVLSGG